MAEKTEKKKPSMAVAVLVVLLIFILVPLLIFGSIYFLNEDFKNSANDFLSGVPGPIGAYFDSFPTPEETEAQIMKIADHMLSIDQERAVDELIIISNDDGQVYDEIVKHMLRMNPNATKAVLEDIRRKSLNKDAVLSLLEEIESEQAEELVTQGEYLKTISLPIAIDEMNDIINGSINGHKQLANILLTLDQSNIARLMNELSLADFNQVMEYFPTETRNQVKTLITSNEIRDVELTNIAELYATESPEDLALILGSTDTYGYEELSEIFKTLGPKKTGQVLAKTGADDFVFELMSVMKQEEILEKGEDNFTPDVLKTLKLYKEFDDNVTELSNIYSRMDSGKVASVIELMIKNTQEPEIYQLDNGDTIEFSDEDLAMEILSNFTQKKVSEIMANLDDRLASEITRKLAIPQS